MPYKDQTNITINKELREKLYKIKYSYDLSWDALFKEVISMIEEEQRELIENEQTNQ